jgi:hypothetical protein
MELEMPNETPPPMPDPAAFIAIFSGNLATVRALAEALCELGVVEKSALIASLERKLSEWREEVPDARILLPLENLVGGLHQGGPPRKAH